MNFNCIKDTLARRELAVSQPCSVFLDELATRINEERGDFLPANFSLPANEDINSIEGYDNLIPFLVDVSDDNRDIYCYEFEQDEDSAVVVFCDHAIVQRWNSVTEFLDWFSNLPKA